MHQLQADVPALQWMGLITETKGPLSVTAQGAAVFYRDQNEKAESRLAQVAEFADLLEELTADEIDLSRLALVLRRFAQGEISLSEAVTHLRAGR
ncbi:hypothetical protein ACF07Y_06960 [Streptomyces sp. NPDC016566]|uniref:hypothetical protein n=1 Tax=Streptomyces sp. NPDC016566 TaxID=3364967 RepID=UPI0036FEB088